MNFLSRLFGSSKPTGVVVQAIDFLTDADRAHGFCVARPTDAALVQSSLRWTPVCPGVSATTIMGVQAWRTFVPFDSTVESVWGVVHLGARRFPLQKEEQLIAYIIARQDVRTRAPHEVPALFLPATNN